MTTPTLRNATSSSKPTSSSRGCLVAGIVIVCMLAAVVALVVQDQRMASRGSAASPTAVEPAAAPGAATAPATPATAGPVCPRCTGRGSIDCERCLGGHVACGTCGGSGRVRQEASSESHGLRATVVRAACQTCGGSGQVPCSRCGGTGRLTCPRCQGSGRLTR